MTVPSEPEPSAYIETAKSSKRLDSAVDFKSCILQERIRCALGSLDGFAGDAEK